jgi:hypothetical protein
MCRAGSSSTHPWHTLPLDLHERILMCLSLHDLGKTVLLGKAFRSAFHLKRLQVEETLTMAGLATFGWPLLTSVGQVLRKYHLRMEAATDTRGRIPGEAFTVDACGTTTAGNKYLLQESEVPVHAVIKLKQRERTEDVIGTLELRLELKGACGGQLGAVLAITGPTRRVTPRSEARLRNRCVFLDILPPRSCKPTATPSDCMGAIFIIACQVGEWPTSQGTPQGPEQAHALPGAPPSAEGVHPVQAPQENPQHTLRARAATPGSVAEASRPTVHQLPQPRAAKAVKRLWHKADDYYAPVTPPVPDSVVDQGVATALKLSAGLPVLCSCSRCYVIMKFGENICAIQMKQQ